MAALRAGGRPGQDRADWPDVGLGGVCRFLMRWAIGVETGRGLWSEALPGGGGGYEE